MSSAEHLDNFFVYISPLIFSSGSKLMSATDHTTELEMSTTVRYTDVMNTAAHSIH